jgi:23S rRNA pseudouridine1911/1915/1917 synthase
MPRNDGFVYRERIEGGSKGERLLAYLTARYHHSSNAEWKARIEAGEVLIEAERAAPEQVLHPGQELTWRRPPWNEPDAPLDYGVLLEDEDLIAVAKPAGLPTLPGAGFLQSTLLVAVRRRVPGATAVHRLGRWTSGVVLFARNRPARVELARQMAGREIGKRYRALASGDPSWDAISIDRPIGPVPHPWLGSVHAADPGGKRSLSRVSVVERRSRAFLCDVAITTGRPHQIRIHLAAAGHPLVGDPLYAEGGIPKAIAPAVPGDPGYLLHAAEMTFCHPRTGLPITVSCPPPPELRCSPPASRPCNESCTPDTRSP